MKDSEGFEMHNELSIYEVQRLIGLGMDCEEQRMKQTQGTLITGTKEEVLGTTTTATKLSWTFVIPFDLCQHENGTYSSIPARLFGRRIVFVCVDCGHILDAKTMQKV